MGDTPKRIVQKLVEMPKRITALETELDAAVADRDRLKTLIEKAPHAHDCASRPARLNPPPCDCWKAHALDAAVADRERLKAGDDHRNVEECWIHLVQMCVIESREEWEKRHPGQALSMEVFAALYKRDTKAEAAIRDAPHTPACVWENTAPQRRCNCWKSKALGERTTSLGSPER